MDQSAERRNCQWYWKKEMKSGTFPGARDGTSSNDNTTTFWICKIQLHCLCVFFKETLQSQYKIIFKIQHYWTITYKIICIQ